mmetsp:Transcript_50646/g.133751  ORF Transcript_50646/g.133751 Transcript_50646/m.133751 type:complete len:219 (-) Transcript_50646:154-810(-)
MSLEHVLHHGVGGPKDIGSALWPSGRTAAHAHARGPHATTGSARLRPESGGVPHADSLVERGRHDEIVLRVEVGRHDVVVVAGEDGNAGARLPVPDADGLVVRRAQDPWVLVMKLHGADVIQVPKQREDTATQLIVPDLDLVVVAARDKERLGEVEADATHRSALVLLELVDQGPDSVVPELNRAIMQAGKDPGQLGVEAQALHAVALCLTLHQHRDL